jgi:predicted RNase H-like HicB family nuclease
MMKKQKVRVWSAGRPSAVLVEKHPDGYLAYPLKMNGGVVGEGNTFEEAVADVTSAIVFHIETFGLHPQN